MAESGQTFKKRVENFWYYHKYHLLIGLAVAAVIAVLAAQCASNQSPDYTVILAMQKSVPDEVAEVMAREFEKYGEDRNGDGRVLVEMVNCSYNSNDTNNTRVMAQIGKLQAQLSLPDSMLIVTDPQYFATLDQQGVFEEAGFLPNQDGKAFNLKETPMEQAVNALSANFFPKEFYLSKRKVAGSTIAEKPAAVQNEAAAAALLDNILEAYRRLYGTSEN